MLPNTQEMLQMCSFDASKSTKGASKLRRDLINAEIANLRDLLPLPSSTRQRLSQLQLMALVCVYVRKANYFQQVFRKCDSGDFMGTNFGFSKALSGFLMMMTQNGKLLYISDNAAEYLGHSMEDLLIHGDSVYDIIDKQDHQAVQSELMRSAPSPIEDERIFLCRMNVSRNARRQMRFGDQKVVLVQGHFLSFLPLCSRNEPVFLATCTPVAMPETRECVVQGSTNIFTSIHSMDMKFVHLDKNGEFHLGYMKDDIQGTSWYHLIHWDSIKEAQTKHRMITQADQDRACILLLRLQSRNGYWLWVHVVLQVKDNMEGSQHPVIVCTNQVLSEKEANVMRANSWLYHYYTVQSKLQYSLALESHATRMPTAYFPSVMPYPHPHHPPQHGAHIQPEATLHAQVLHHPHHHTAHPHHHHHHHHLQHHHPHHHHHHLHHHHQQGLSSHNGSVHSSLAPSPQYSFSSSAYQHLSTTTNNSSASTSPAPSPVYTRLAPLPSWMPVANPPAAPLASSLYRTAFSEVDERHSLEDSSGYSTPSENLIPGSASIPLPGGAAVSGVTCGMVQLVPSNIRPMHPAALCAKYERKVRQLGAEAIAGYGGTGEEEEALTSCKDDLVSVIRSPSQSEPQTVPDLAAAILSTNHPGEGFNTRSLSDTSRTSDGHEQVPTPLDGCDPTMEQFVPEFTVGQKEFKGSLSSLSEHVRAWMTRGRLENGRLAYGRPWVEPAAPTMHLSPSPPYSAGSSDYTVPHTPEEWPATPPLTTVPSNADSPSERNHSNKSAAIPRKRRKVGRSKVADDSDTSSNYTGDLCPSDLSPCSPMCLCQKYYDSEMPRAKDPTGSMSDKSRYGCSMTAQSEDLMASFGVPQPSLPKPLPLKMPRTSAEGECALQWPGATGVGGVSSQVDPVPLSPIGLIHQDVLVATPTENSGHYQSSMSPQEWSAIFCGQQCARSTCEHQHDVPGCTEHKCRNG